MLKLDVFNRKIIFALFIFTVALFIRISYVETTEFIDPIKADAQKYFMTALNLYYKGIYSWQDGVSPRPTTSLMPGYPLFVLANFYISPQVNSAFFSVLLAQAFIGAITAVILFAISLRILPFLWAVLFGMIMALLPHHVVFSGYVLTETVFTFIFISGVYALVRACETGFVLWWILAGVLAGVASLTRPAALFFIPCALVALVFFRAAAVRSAMIAFAALVMTVLPWSLWAANEQKPYPEETSFAAASFAFGSYPDFIYKSPEMRGYPYREDAEYEYMSRSMSNAVSVVSHRAAAEPWKYLYWYIVGKPLTYWSWSMMDSVGGPYIYQVGHNFWQDTTQGRIALALSRGIHPLLSVAGMLTILVVACRAFRKKGLKAHKDNPAFLIVVLVVVYFTGVHTILAAWPRYAVPFWPFLYLLGLLGLYQGGHLLMSLRASAKEKATL